MAAIVPTVPDAIGLYPVPHHVEKRMTKYLIALMLLFRRLGVAPTTESDDRLNLPTIWNLLYSVG